MRQACLQRISAGYRSIEIGEYEVAEATLREALATADRVTEVSLEGSGSLGVLSWGETEPELVFEVTEGPLRLRASFSGLAAADSHPDNDVSGEELSPETILLQLWPAPPAEPSVLQPWAGPR